MTLYSTPPEVDSGFDLASVFDVFVVEPDPMTNVCINPSFETNTTGWTAIGGSIARVATQQRHGAYGLQVTPSAGVNDGVSYTQGFAAANATKYLMSVAFKGAAGIPYRIFFADTANAAVSVPRTFVGTGYWQRVFTFFESASAVTRRVVVSKNNSASTAPFFIDGVLIAVSDHDTLYFDGDTEGYFSDTDYQWLATPHASQSVRNPYAASTGRLIEITNETLATLAMTGLGKGPTEIVTVPTPGVGGSVYQGTTIVEKPFTMAARLYADQASSHLQYRRQLFRVFNRLTEVNAQELTLLFRPKGTQPFSIAQDVFVPALYEPQPADLLNPVASSFELRFRSIRPSLGMGYDAAAAIGNSNTFTLNNIAERRSGLWTNMNGGVTAGVGPRTSFYDANGILFMCGGMTTVGGVAVTRVASWDGSAITAYSALGTGAEIVRGLAKFGTSLYAAGNFTTPVTGFATAVGAGAWGALGAGGPNGALCDDVIVNNAGVVYVMTTAGTVWQWDGSTWTSLGSVGVGGQVSRLALGPNGELYRSNGGTAIQRFVSGTTWTTIGTASSTVRDISVGPDGRVYATGDFVTIDSVACVRIGVYNGVSWEALGAGLNNTGWCVTVDDQNLVHVVGVFTTAGGITLQGGYALWNGFQWQTPDISVPAGDMRTVSTFAGRVFIGTFNATVGTATWGGTTTVTNESDAAAYPTVTLLGPASGTTTVWRLESLTTGRKIAFNLTLSANERVTMRFAPGVQSIYSSIRGELINSVLQTGSSLSGFLLAPGSNSVLLYVTGTALQESVMSWKEAFHGVDSLAR